MVLQPTGSGQGQPLCNSPASLSKGSEGFGLRGYSLRKTERLPLFMVPQCIYPLQTLQPVANCPINPPTADTGCTMAQAAKQKINHDPHHVHENFVGLTSIEEKALAMLRPFDVNAIQPVLVRAKTKMQRDIWNYWRIVISSANQGIFARGQYRGHDWFLIDRVSQGLLGVISLADLDHHWAGLYTFVGGPFGEDRKAMGLRSSITRLIKEGGDTTEKEAALVEYMTTHDRPADTNHCVQQLKRCLPIHEFGVLTGGKLLALASCCSELIQTAELNYSRPLALMVVKTLHGRTSQYNRLNQRGMVFIKDETLEAGAFYAQPLHRDWSDFLLGKVPNPGPLITYSFADQVAYWRERWLANRIVEHSDNGWVRPNVEKYRLSNQLRDRLIGGQQGSDHE